MDKKNVEAIYPLSPMQQGMLFETLYSEKVSYYIEQISFSIAGTAFNPQHFMTAWQNVLDKHHTLRSLFVWEKTKKPVQIVLKQLDINFKIIDWQAISESEQQTQLQQYLQQDSVEAFVLDDAPLMRFCFIQLAADKWHFVWTHHHLLMDGWSLGIVLKDFFEFYQAHLKQQTISVQATKHYASYIQWLAKQDNVQAQRFWQQNLQHVQPTHYFQTLISQKTPNYVEQTFSLPTQAQTDIQQFTQQHQLTFYSVVQGAWALLLNRYSEQNDVVFGTTVSGRPSDIPHIESTVGLFINTLPVRTIIDGQENLVTWLKQLQQNQVEHEQYAYSSLANIQTWAGLDSGQKLFETLLVVENYPLDESIKQHVQSINIQDLNIAEQAPFPLTITFIPHLSLQVRLTYDSHQFDMATIQQLFEHLQFILEQFVTSPNQALQQFSLLTTKENTLLEKWSQTQTSEIPKLSMHQLFEQQVEKTPNNLAVIFEEQSLTYQQLNTKANLLAHYLQAKGIKPDTLVGLCLERSLEVVISILGILKAGGAYVPLELAYPDERLNFIINDAKAPILLTSSKLATKFAQITNTEILCLDQIHDELQNQPAHNTDSHITSKNLCYVIYTSGSTGTPKGCLIEHGNVSRLFTQTQAWYQFNQNDVWTLFHSYAFDFSVWELWGALIYGGKLVVVPYWVSRSISDFHQLLQQHQVTVLNQTPSAFYQLIQIDTQDNEQKLDLRYVIFGGEALDIPALKPWFNKNGDKIPQLVNMYGITETTVHVTYRPLSLADLNSSASVIGQPIPDLSLFILDSQQHRVPLNIAGEMYVGGLGVARGYLNRDELTAQRFIANPFNPSEKLYRTGDLARYLPNGDIQYLGRIDHQVKIRGFRIELGEIEAVLIRYPDVQTACVTIREEQASKRIVAYFVATQSLDTMALQDFMQQSLPDYMLPKAFVQLDKLPLTPNGKVDLKALPIPDANPISKQIFTAPQTEIECTLAAIWSEVLGVEQVGIHDNFFALGGDSILSIQVVARANQQQIKLTPRLIFQYQTIAALVSQVNKVETAQTQQDLVTGEIALTPIQHWFFEQNLTNPHHYNQSLILTVTNDIQVDLLEQSIRYLLQHHDILRVQFQKIATNEWKQYSLKQAADFHLEVENIAELDTQSQQAAMQARISLLQASLDIEKAQLIKAVLFQNVQQHHLAIIIHHLAIDGVSWRILLEDIATIYQQLEQQKTVQLPAKTTAFQDWAIYLQNTVEKLEHDAGFWLQQISSNVSIPIDFKAQAADNTVQSSAEISLRLSAEQTTYLLQDVSPAYNTKINDILLTALALTLSDWMEKSTILVDLEGHGREIIDDGMEQLDLSRTVGWFTSLYPVALQIEQKQAIEHQIKSIKEQLRAIPHNGVSYGILRYLNQNSEIQQQLHNLPTAQISFNYLGQFEQGMQNGLFSGIQVEKQTYYYDQGNQRAYLLDFGLIVLDGQLEVNCVYSQAFHQPEHIEQLVQNYVAHLQNLINHCLSNTVGAYTPSDFPDVQFTQTALDALLQPLASHRNIEAIYPLSPLQKGMLFDSLYSPDTLSYFVQIHFELEQVNLVWLKQAWAEVQQRHPVLRTLFAWGNQEQPLQIVLKQAELNWHEQNWQADDSTTQNEKLSQFLQQDKKTGFKLDQAPLMRCHIIKLGADKYHFIWSHHHIILDGWSFPIVLQEVLAIYRALSEGNAPQLPTLPAFKQYIQWIQQLDKQKAQEYWTQTLASVTAPTSLSIKKAQFDENETRYIGQQFNFSTQIKSVLQDFTREQHVTLNTLVQAAWALVLAGYSRNQAVLFGSMVSGRPAELQQIESMVGLFANTMPVYIEIDSQKTVKQWLAQLQSEQIERAEFSYESLVDIQQWSNLPAGVNLFDSVVVTENYPLDESLATGSETLQLRNPKTDEHANSPLILVFSLFQDELSVQIIYDENQFLSSDIERLFEHLSLTLSHLFENKDQPVSIPMLLTETEQNQLAAWNSTDKDYPHACLHQLVERQVQATPNAIAAIYQNQHLTYKQLNAKANQLAHYLGDLGVKTEDFVGIYVERSLEMMIGLLGILKAGAAYVPLDPTYPADRVAFMLQDAQPPVLLTQQYLLDSLPEHQSQIVCLDSDWNKIAKKSRKNLNLPIELNQLAYMIYTSGSTGKPKGAMNPHLAISNRLLWMQDAYQLTEKDTVLQKTPFSFDVSVWEFFWPLLAGAKLVFAKPEGHKDAAYLAQLIQQTQITTLHFVPSMLQLFLQTDGLSQCGSLRQVFCSGEALPVDLQNKFFEAFPNVELHNLYGPTEAAVDVTYWQCQADEKCHTVPIGKPINNIQIHILDNELRPVPIGISGELHIAGIGVARGYHNRPELSTEKFIDNPLAQPETLIIPQPEPDLNLIQKIGLLFNSKSNQAIEPFTITTTNKLYKTGDLARWLPEGEIEYLGRMDHQVKIRGFRIELGEIEAVISQSPQVNECMMLVQEGNEIEDKQLIAFIVPEAEQDASQESAYVEQVSEIYHHTYGEVDEQATDFNIAGWNSSYTSKAIPDIEMQEWVKYTVQRILALKPQNIVEIGCGTGLLLSRIAPCCRAYLGLDLSAEAVAHVSQLQKSHPELKNVSLQQAPADDFSIIAKETYNTLVINSVVQHFPSIQYFANVLKQAVETVQDGGRVFVGDIRSFSLLENYHASVQLYQTNDKVNLAELKQRINKQLAQEEELVIDPHFFTALQAQYPRIQHIEIYPKRGEFYNELTKFRFDVVLHIGQAPELCKVEWQDWQPQWDLTAIREYLSEKQPKIFGLREISNLRLVEENALLQQLNQEQTRPSIAEFREQFDKAVSINPEALYQLAEELGYQIEISWLNTDEWGQFSAVFKQVTIKCLAEFAKPDITIGYQTYANAPLQQSGVYQQNLVIDLKQRLQQQLPNYMSPAHYVLLDQIPLTPNGKADRKALLAMDIHSNRDTNNLQPARDNIEKALVEIWQEVLNVQPIGIIDNFFELGGHSLLAIRVMSKIQQQFGQNLPLATLFEGSTIKGLADIVRDKIQVLDWQPVVKIQSEGTKPILYCVPGAGGNVLYYYNLAHLLGIEHPFYGLQSKGLDGVSTPLDTIEAIAAHHIEHIKQAQPTGEYYICGHSFGGFVAFEIARQLEQQGDKVALLAILDLDASFQGGQDHACHHWDEVTWIVEYSEQAELMTKKRMRVKREDLLPLSSQERYEYFKQQLEKAGILPPNTSLEQFIGYVIVFKSNFLAMMKYCEPQQVKLAAKVALLRTKTGVHSDTNIAILQDPAWGWQQFIQQPVMVYNVPGDHLSMLSQPHVTFLAEKLNHALDNV